MSKRIISIERFSSKRIQRETDSNIDDILDNLAELNIRDNSEENKFKIDDLPAELLEIILNNSDTRSSLRFLATNKGLFQNVQFEKPKPTILTIKYKSEVIKIDNTRNKKINRYLSTNFSNNILTIDDECNKFSIKINMSDFGNIYNIYYIRAYKIVVITREKDFYFIMKSRIPKDDSYRVTKIERDEKMLLLFLYEDRENPFKIIPTKILKYKNLTIATMENVHNYIIGIDDKFFMTNFGSYLYSVFQEMLKILNIKNQTDAMIKLKEFYDKFYDISLKPFIDETYKEMSVFYI